jgi:hypothetical protein
MHCCQKWKCQWEHFTIILSDPRAKTFASYSKTSCSTGTKALALEEMLPPGVTTFGTRHLFFGEAIVYIRSRPLSRWWPIHFLIITGKICFPGVFNLFCGGVARLRICSMDCFMHRVPNRVSSSEWNLNPAMSKVNLAIRCYQKKQMTSAYENALENSSALSKYEQCCH